MEAGSVTTPFGRRSMSLGMFATQIASQQIAADQSKDKWRLYRAVCEARPRLGVTDRALSVLNALLSFHPAAELSAETGLIVFPSNALLSLRAHGMAEPTLRRHLAALVDAGLILRKDSPNGKRYARRAGEGTIREAFGFSLAPLLARAAEIEQLAAEVATERRLSQQFRERLTLYRRDVTKMLSVAVAEGVDGDWADIRIRFHNALERLSRSKDQALLLATVDAVDAIRQEIANRLELHLESKNPSGNPTQTERHIEDSHISLSIESEQALKLQDGARARSNIENDGSHCEGAETKQSNVRQNQAIQPNGRTRGQMKSFPLDLVIRACPQIVDYSPGGSIRHWRDLMGAATVVRSMLNISPSAYELACNVMGPENAATVVACILERAGHINCAGGYLRDLSRRAERDEFAIGPMLMALARPTPFDNTKRLE